jgi:hypothetical protein
MLVFADSAGSEEDLVALRLRISARGPHRYSILPTVECGSRRAGEPYRAGRHSWDGPHHVDEKPATPGGRKTDSDVDRRRPARTFDPLVRGRSAKASTELSTLGRSAAAVCFRDGGRPIGRTARASALCGSSGGTGGYNGCAFSCAIQWRFFSLRKPFAESSNFSRISY